MLIQWIVATYQTLFQIFIININVLSKHVIKMRGRIVDLNGYILED